MRHIRIPRRERIRNSEVVNVVDNTPEETDPYKAILYHLDKLRIIIKGHELFKKKDLTAIKRSITSIENKVKENDE